jgi:predicted HicB family RNase H-like nuclease
MSRNLSYKGHHAAVEFSAEDDLFVGRIAGINDIVTFEGESVAALKAAFQEAVDDYLAACAEIGKKPEKAYSGQLMLRLSPEVHAKAALAAELAGKSLNQWSEEALAAAADAE